MAIYLTAAPLTLLPAHHSLLLLLIFAIIVRNITFANYLYLGKIWMPIKKL
jgi:hypothetical protein